MIFDLARFEPGGEKLPEEQVVGEKQEGLSLTPAERDVLRQAWRALRRRKPELFRVLDARRKSTPTRIAASHGSF